MDAKQYGNRPAFPYAAMTEQVVVPTQHPGMTVREVFAGLALQGLLANPVYAEEFRQSGNDPSDAALFHANRLVAELAKDGA